MIQGGEASNLWTLGGGGALDVAWGALNLQADFLAEGNIDETSANDTYLRSYGGGLHFGWRDPELGSFGGFGGAGDVRINSVDEPDPDTTVWAAGLEGQAFFDRFTLYLQSGYLDRETLASGGDPGALKDAGFGRALGRYFLRDDLKLEAETSYAQGKMDPDSDKVWILGWGTELEYRLGSLPLSGFFRYTGARYDQSDDKDVLYEHRIGFGVRVYFGRESLLANDRHGASLEMPHYLEWNGQTAGALE